MRRLKFLLAACALMLGASQTFAQTDVTATHLTNADLSSTEGWTDYSSSGFHEIGNGLIGTYKVHDSFSVATVDDTHLATENCFGFECRWSTNYASYNQTTSELPAGRYELTFDVENVNGSTNNATYNNLFYVKVGETTYSDNTTEWMRGQSSWTTHTISFAITQPAKATVSFGYGTGDNNFGQANTPVLYVSHVKLTQKPYTYKTVYLAPGAWDVSDATERYALYMYNSDNDNAWTSFTEGEDGVWSAQFNDAYSKMIICRMNGETTDNNWNQGVKWNQTGNLDAPGADGLLYTINAAGNNPAYSISIYGNTPATFTDGGKYLFKNVGTGRYLGPGNSWGTRASLIVSSHYNTLHLNNGVYTLESQLSGSGLGENLFLDSDGGQKLTISSVENDIYNISDGDKIFGYDGSSYELANNLSNPAANNAKWQIIPVANALDGATMESPVDATYLILDANFDRNSRHETKVADNNWTGVWTMEASNQNLSGGNNTNNCAESYHAVFTLSQTINNVPNGIYEMTAQGFYRQDGSDNEHLPYFYINSGKQTFPVKTGSENSMSDASGSFTNGLYTIEPIRVTVTDGTITLGAKNESNTSLWCIFDNFTLKYYGVDLSAYETTIASLRSELNDLLSSPMNAAVKSNAETAYSETANVEHTVSAMEAAIATLNNALDAVKTSVANYAEAATILAADDKYDSFGQESYAANEAIAAIQTAYDNGTLEVVTAEQKAAATAALAIACKAQKQPADGCDMTPWIVNPGIDGNVNGWTTEKKGNTDGTGGPLKPSNDCMEYWGGDTFLNQADTKGFDYYQIIKSLPDGAYTISADLYHSTNGESGATWNDEGSAGVYGKTANDEVITLVKEDGTTFKQYTTNEILVIDGELRLGVKNIRAMAARWFVADNFKLTYVRQLNDTEKAAIAKEEYDDVLARAKTVAATTETVSAHWLGELHSTIDNYENKVDETSAEALLAAAADLIAATTIVEKSIASYAIIASGTVRTDVLDGWSCTNSQTFHINTWSTEGNAGNDPSGMTTPFIENWIANGSVLGEGTFSYTLEYLEPGEVYYAQALIRSYNEKDATAPNGPDFFVNGTSAKLSEVGTTFTYKGMSGIYATLGAAAEVGADGKITIGARIAADANYNWVAFKNVSIQPMDVVLAAAVKLVTDLEGTLPAGIYNAAYAVVLANTGENKPTTPKGYDDAIAAIEAAAETAKLAYAPVAENAKILAKANDATTKLAGLTDTDKATLQGVIDGNTDALAACADVAAIEAQNTALWTAIGEAINSINVTDQLDLTFLLTNPNVDDFYNGQYNVHVDGWYTEQESGNFQVVPGEGCANDDGIHKHAYEFWSENPRANNKFLLYQKLQLPEGTYTIDCYAFCDQSMQGNDPSVPIDPAVHGVYFYANDTEGSCVTTNKLAEQGISFVNDAQQEVKIGLKALTGNTYRWVGIGYMQLFKVPAQSYTVDETVAWDNKVSGAGDVTLNRTIKAGVNTLVLPFSMTQEEVKTNFGEDSKVYVVSKYENDNISFETHDGISANMPCLLKATVAGTSYTLNDRTIVAGEPIHNATNVTMTGTYAASMTVPANEGNYIISGGKIYNVNSSVTLKNTRAYITPAGASARTLTMSFDDGTTTGIATLENGELKVETGDIYDLSGRKVNNPTKGLYIINGKKIVK